MGWVYLNPLQIQTLQHVLRLGNGQIQPPPVLIHFRQTLQHMLRLGNGWLCVCVCVCTLAGITCCFDAACLWRPWSLVKFHTKASRADLVRQKSDVFFSARGQCAKAGKRIAMFSSSRRALKRFLLRNACWSVWKDSRMSGTCAHGLRPAVENAWIFFHTK